MAHQNVIRDVPIRPERSFARPAVLALAPLTHVTLRAGTGLLFMEHGLQKLFGFFGGMGAPGQTAPRMSQMGLAGVLELVGGILLFLGLFTRPVAAILFVEMLVAFVMAHLPHGGWPIENGGELALLYALVFAFLAMHGAGSLSVDASLRARRNELAG